VSGRGEGQATISARSGDVLGQAMVRVIRPAPNCAEVRTFGNGETISGELPSVRIVDNVTVAGATNVCGTLEIGGAGSQLTLSGQQLTVAGNFTAAGSHFQAFASTSTRVRLNGTVAQTVSFFSASAANQRFRDLEITNATGVTFSNNAFVSGNLDLVRQMTVPAGVSGIQQLFLRSTAVLNNQGAIQTTACTKEPGHTINGTDPCP